MRKLDTESETQSADQSRHTLSHILLDLASLCRAGPINIKLIMERLGVRGHAVVVVVFSLPFLQPIPIPGLSAFLGLIIAFSGLALALGFPLVFPRWISERSLPPETLEKILRWGAGAAQKIEGLVRPRFVYLFELHAVRLSIGIMIIGAALVLALPLPPGTNFPPAITTALLGLGRLERDGLLVALGAFFFTLMVGLFALISHFGFAAIYEYLRTS